MIEEGGCWPTHEQELLLKAALFRGQPSIDAFAEWQRVVGFDHLDEGSYRMLPLLGNNLHAQGVDHPMIGRLRGIHRRAWYENQMLFRGMEPVLHRLQAAGIQCLLLKGAALVLQCYHDAGLRPMRDFDILVPEEQAVAAVGLLLDDGWRVLTAWPGKLTESFRRFRQAIALEHESGRQLDLHWHVLYDCCRKGADHEFWAASVPLELHGISLGGLAPSDQFLLVCVHGVDWNEVAPIRWIADAITVLRQSPGLDWERIVKQTERRRLVPRVRDALHYLASRMEAPIPEGVLRSLDSLPVTRAEMLEYQRIVKPHDLQGVVDTWRALYQQHRRSALTWNPIDFVRFMGHYWHVKHFWQFAPMAGRWGRGRIKHFLAQRRSAASIEDTRPRGI
jgi:hypothetical protein